MTIKTLSIKFDTAPYCRSHFKNPKGHGSWAFSVDRAEPVFSPSMTTFADAKKWIVEKVRREAPTDAKFVIIDVLP